MLISIPVSQNDSYTEKKEENKLAKVVTMVDVQNMPSTYAQPTRATNKCRERGGGHENVGIFDGIHDVTELFMMKPA